MTVTTTHIYWAGRANVNLVFSGVIGAVKATAT